MRTILAFLKNPCQAISFCGHYTMPGNFFVELIYCHGRSARKGYPCHSGQSCGGLHDSSEYLPIIRYFAIFAHLASIALILLPFDKYSQYTIFRGNLAQSSNNLSHSPARVLRLILTVALHAAFIFLLVISNSLNPIFLAPETDDP